MLAKLKFIAYEANKVSVDIALTDTVTSIRTSFVMISHNSLIHQPPELFNLIETSY